MAFLKQGSLDLCARVLGALLPESRLSDQTRSSLAARRWGKAEDRTKSTKVNRLSSDWFARAALPGFHNKSPCVLRRSCEPRCGQRHNMAKSKRIAAATLSQPCRLPRSLQYHAADDATYTLLRYAQSCSLFNQSIPFCVLVSRLLYHRSQRPIKADCAEGSASILCIDEPAGADWTKEER